MDQVNTNSQYNPCLATPLNGLFSPAECATIIALAHRQPLESATVNNKVDVSNRVTDLQWLDPTPETEWIFRRIYDKALDVNHHVYKFELKTLEKLQYLHYMTGHYFKPHFDFGGQSLATRKLTISIQLSKPDEYTGGNLEVHDGFGVTEASRNIGDAIIFPTYLRHQATEVTSGTRECLVGWMCGERPFA